MSDLKRLYQHIPHPHIPRNVNDLHQAEYASASFNQRLAVALTKATSSMICAYIFTILALIGLFGLLGWLNPFTFLLATWISQQFLQLVFLPILSVGQSVLGRKAELQADEGFRTTQKSFADIEQIMGHLSKQDEELLKQTHLLEIQQQHILKQNDLIAAIQHRLAEQTMYRRD